jgi:hypothetical protein
MYHGHNGPFNFFLSFFDSVTRQIVSFSEPKLFFIDPVLIMMALLYRRGWFKTGSTRSARSLFTKNTLTIPLAEDKMKMPVFAACPRQ